MLNPNYRIKNVINCWVNPLQYNDELTWRKKHLGFQQICISPSLAIFLNFNISNNKKKFKFSKKI
jgi:hypothetical protein